MQSIILVTHCSDFEFSDVSSAVDCIQLGLCMRRELYMFGWVGWPLHMQDLWRENEPCGFD